MTYALKDLLDIPRLQSMLDALDEIYSLPSAIIDAKGTILTAIAWQDICTKFHRVHPEAEKLCRESDTRIVRELGRTAGPVVYTCPFGLVDTATPIVVDGVNLGSVFTGQLFTAPPDEERFVRQARLYEFDEHEYLAALRKVPVITEARLRKNLAFLGNFTEMLAEIGVKTKRRIEISEALQQSEARYRRITEGLTDYQYTVRVENGQAVQTTQSPACEQVTGYTAEEFAADPLLWIRMVAPEDRELVTDRVRTILSGKEIPPVEHRILRKDGQLRWVRDTTIQFTDDAGRLQSYDGVIKDITDQRQAEDALRASEEKYHSLFDSSRDVIYISTPEGRFLDVNPAGVKLLGYPSKEALLAADVLTLYVHPEDRSRLLDLLNEHDFVEDFKTLFLRPDRQQVNVSITATAVRDAAGRVATIRGIIRDVTETMRLESQLRQSQKMESIGTLAGGVAHDFNNILTIISGYTHLILMKMAPNDPQRRSLQNILEASGRATHLTGDLLLFSRKQPINRKPVDLNDGIRKLSTFLARVIGEDIAFNVHLCEGRLPVLADEHQVSQVLMNLATNARDAIPDGGSFTITSEQVRLDEEFVAAHRFGKPGCYALITVMDDGKGMDETTRQRVFEPFFTTKDPGKGTGLGMAVVYGIVKQHDGLVSVESQPGEGTTFRIWLPLIGTGSADGSTAAAAELPAGGTETILLAEDDAAVREMTRLLLRDYGYTVIAAVDGEDAVRTFRENKDRVRLLLFDMVMPKKSGLEAYEEIRRLDPGVKVIFASGYDPDQVRQKSLRELQVPVLRKPMEMAALLKTIRSVLDA